MYSLNIYANANENDTGESSYETSSNEAIKLLLKHSMLSFRCRRSYNTPGGADKLSTVR